MCNPVATFMEAIKFILTGHGTFSLSYILLGVRRFLWNVKNKNPHPDV